MGCVSCACIYKTVAHIQTKIKPRIFFPLHCSKKAAERTSRKEIRETVYVFVLCLFFTSFLCPYNFLSMHMLLYCETTTTTSTTKKKHTKKEIAERIFFFSFFLCLESSVRGKKRQKHRKILFRYQLYKT